MAKIKAFRGRARTVGEKAGRKIRTVLPPTFRSHMKASIREGLLAFESLFDEVIKNLEKAEREPKAKASRRGKKIRVE